MLATWPQQKRQRCLAPKMLASLRQTKTSHPNIPKPTRHSRRVCALRSVASLKEKRKRRKRLERWRSMRVQSPQKQQKAHLRALERQKLPEAQVFVLGEKQEKENWG